MKTILGIALLSFTLQPSIAQQTAMDFTMDDCYGQMHNLYSTLDSGNVVIMEFFMDCSACIKAGNSIQSMKNKLDILFPDRIRFYQIAYTNSYACNTVLDFVNTNGFTGVPFDSGAAQVEYYGGFGMPTVVVTAGELHEVLFIDIGWTDSDTLVITDAVTDFFNSTGFSMLHDEEVAYHVFPNPADGFLNFNMKFSEPVQLTIELIGLDGRVITQLLKGNWNSGILEKTCNIESLIPGIYFLKISINENVSFQKSLVIH